MGRKKGDERKLKVELNEELLTLEILVEDNMLSSEQLERKTEIQKQLMVIFEHEEIYWNERSNCNWLLKGDGNTKYFHRIENGKNKKQFTPCNMKIG